MGWYSSSVYVATSSKEMIVGSSYGTFYALDAFEFFCSKILTFLPFLTANRNTGDELWKKTYSGTWSRLGAGVAMAPDWSSPNDVTFCVGHDNTGITCVDEDGNDLLHLNVDPTNDREVGSLCMGKLDGSNWNVIVGISCTPRNYHNTHILNTAGNVIMRKPDQGGVDGVALGIFVKNHALSDITGDGNLEIIAPSDDYAVCAWDRFGNHLPVNDDFYNANNKWGGVIFSRNYQYEYRGWPGSPNHEWKPYFANSPTTIFKYNNEKIIAVVGMYSNFLTEPPTNMGKSIFLLHTNRTRFKDLNNGIDWSKTPEMFTPISNDWRVIFNPVTAIAVVDLYGNGLPHLIVSGDDGYVHCYNLYGQEPDFWPFKVTNIFQMRFASEVVVFQRPNEGPIIVFCDWAQKDHEYNGKLYFIRYNGMVLFTLDLPDPEAESRVWNGGMSGPTLFRYEQPSSNGNNLFLNIQTYYSGNVLYEIENTENAIILWQTSRANFQRDGNVENMVESLPFNLDPDRNIISLIIGTTIGGFSFIILISIGIIVLFLGFCNKIFKSKSLKK